MRHGPLGAALARVAALIRTGASLLLEAPEEVFAEVDAAVLADPEHPVASDPVLTAAIRRNNRANLLHWAECNLRDPGARVPPNLRPTPSRSRATSCAAAWTQTRCRATASARTSPGGDG